MCCGNEAGSYLRLIDSSITLKDLLGPVTRVKKKKKEKTLSTYGMLDMLRSARDRTRCPPAPPGGGGRRSSKFLTPLALSQFLLPPSLTQTHPTHTPSSTAQVSLLALSYRNTGCSTCSAPRATGAAVRQPLLQRESSSLTTYWSESTFSS